MLIVSNSDDPQFELSLSEDVLSRVGPGCHLEAEITARPLLEALPSLLEQYAMQPTSPQLSGEPTPALIQELGEATLLFRKVVEKRNSTINRQREQLQAQEAIQQKLQSQLHKAEAQLDVLKEFVASAFGNANDRI
tara:strand:+ start:216 stop:623 length:408 start_codon:yes stop_codon:yes gene_type:complete